MAPEQRMLLVSDGSLTLHMEALLGGRVDVEVLRNGCSPMDREIASYLEAGVHGEAIDREVWLKVEGKRLVYAYSLIPTACVEGWLMHALAEGRHPIGRVLQERGIPVIKDRLELGIITCAAVARDLGIDNDTPLVARRYRLFNRKQNDGEEGEGEEGGWIVKAAVTEVFSPGFVPAFL